MLLLIVASLSALAVWALARPWSRWRLQVGWGMLFGLPLAVVQLVVAGGLLPLGVDGTDAVLTLIGVAAAGSLSTSLLILVYGRWIEPHLSPTSHAERQRLSAFALGVVTVAGLGLVGVPLILAAIIGLGLNFLVFIALRRLHLIWDVVLTAGGLAAWYGIFGALLAVQTSGHLEVLLGERNALGLTFMGQPVDVLLFYILAGAVLGPLFAATKPWRTTHQVAHRWSTARMSLGLALIVVMVAGVGFGADQYILPPRVTALEPAARATNLETTTELIVRFNRPVDRDQLELSIEPAAEGTWLFEQPTAGRHGYRRARFQFSPTLEPGTRYRGQISGIRSLWATPGRAVDFVFTTRPAPEVMGFATNSFNGCQPIDLLLSSENDQSFDWAATVTPAVPLTVSASGPTVLSLVPDTCLSPNQQYRLHVTRRTVTRDPVTKEIVAADEPVSVFDSDVQTSPAAGSAVMGVASAQSGLQPVRRQTILNIRQDYQDQALSCEAAALKMALAGRGVRVSERQIMQHIGYDRTPHKGSVWGDPDKAFVGNIAGRQNTTGYGVHWTPVARAARAWRPARAFRNATPEFIAQQISRGFPVVIWGTLNRAYRTNWYTPQGKLIRAWKGEHARTIIGFYGPPESPTHFVLNDPAAGRLVWSRATLVYNSGAFLMSGVVVE